MPMHKLCLKMGKERKLKIHGGVQRKEKLPIFFVGKRGEYVDGESRQEREKFVSVHTVDGTQLLGATLNRKGNNTSETDLRTSQENRVLL